MTDRHVPSLASTLVCTIGAFWGLYWMPVRALEAAGLPGAWGSFVIVVSALIVLLPVAWRWRRVLARCDLWALMSLLTGGASFALYSIAFLYGEVAVIILLFYLTPVWSTVIAWVWLGQPQTRLRVLAIFLGLSGLSLVLWGGSGAVPWPGSPGEWLGLLAGLLWAVANTGLKQRPETDPAAAGVVFVLGAVVCTLPAVIFFSAPPVVAGDLTWLALAVGSGALWWGALVTALIWAAARLDPARIGILLMSEVVVGAASAALLAGESISASEWAGGGLVLLAAICELRPADHKVGLAK